MAVDIRLPNINAKTEAEQQIRSYLIQLAEQLNFALKNADTTNNTVVVNTTTKSLQPSSQPSVVSPEATFNSIKALIIKSADIVNAYYEEIHKKLEGQYVAQSDFGTFKETTEQYVTESSKSIERSFVNIQEVDQRIVDSNDELDGKIGDIDSKINDKIDKANENLQEQIDGVNGGLADVNKTIKKVNAHITMGELYKDQDGTPVIGIEVGQTNTVIKEDGTSEEVFNKYARFKSDRLSFFNRFGVEVAYIGDKKLYIKESEIQTSSKIGGYIDTVNPETGDLITKWEGVE